MTSPDPIYPDFIIETPGGIRHTMDKDKGVAWLLQFPEDKLVGSEWTPFAWPGGYEIHYYTKDGGVLCYQCANENLDLTLGDDPQWQIVGRDINYEDPDCYCDNCDNCNRKIKPEYGEDEALKTKDEIINELDHFTGTEHYYKLHSNLLITDGVKYLCDECKAFWLMDVIWSYLPQVPKDEHFLVVKLDVKGEAGVFWMGDDVPPAHVDIRQEIGFTNFPLDSITLYVSRREDKWVVMLTSEY